MARIPTLPPHPEGDDAEARLYRRCVDAGIGRLPDHVVARDLGVGPITVWQYRRRFGIPLAVDRRRGTKPVALPEAELLRRVRRAAHQGIAFSRIVVEVGTSPRRLRALVRGQGIELARRRRIDWGSADWSLSNQEIAEALGCSATTVIVKRLQLRRCGVPIPGTPRSQPGAAILTAERSRTLERDIRGMAAKGMSRIAIARSLHVEYDLVSLLVGRCGIPIQRRPHGVDWTRIDWKLPNAEIARRVGVRKEHVSSRRKALRKRGVAVPPAPDPNAARVGRLAERVRPLAVDGLSAAEIAKRLRCSVDRVRHAARVAGTRLSRPSRACVEWEALDWSLSNPEIAGRIGVGRGTVATWRSKLRKGGLAVSPSTGGGKRGARGRPRR